MNFQIILKWSIKKKSSSCKDLLKLQALGEVGEGEMGQVVKLIMWALSTRSA